MVNRRGHECAAAEVLELRSHTGVPYMCQPLKYISFTYIEPYVVIISFMRIFDGLFC